MAKSKYDDVITPNLKLIGRWYRNGATDEEVAEKLNISKTTLYKYVEEHFELSELRKRSKEIIDSEVEEALLKKSLGFTQTVKKAFKVKHVKYNDNGKRISEDEEVVQADEEVYVAPSDTAMIFWLKNRQPELWKDKHEVEHSGSLKLEDIL